MVSEPLFVNLICDDCDDDVIFQVGKKCGFYVWTAGRRTRFDHKKDYFRHFALEKRGNYVKRRLKLSENKRICGMNRQSELHFANCVEFQSFGGEICAILVVFFGFADDFDVDSVGFFEK